MHRLRLYLQNDSQCDPILKERHNRKTVNMHTQLNAESKSEAQISCQKMCRRSQGRRKQKAKSGAARKRRACHLLLNPNAQNKRNFDTPKICTCRLLFATFWLHLEQMMIVPGSSIKLLHLADRKFPEAFKIKIMNNDEMMKSRENEKF